MIFIKYYRHCKNNECKNMLGSECLKAESRRDYCRDCVHIDLESRLACVFYNDHDNKALWDKYVQVSKRSKEYDYRYDGPKGPRALFLFLYEIP